VTLPEGLDSKAMMPRAIAARVAYVPGTGFYADGTGTGNMRLNFSFPPPDRIREGVRRLASVMEQDLAMRQVFGTVSRPVQHRRGQAGADAPGPDLA
jgi:2-aminoadipate transaminase